MFDSLFRLLATSVPVMMVFMAGQLVMFAVPTSLLLKHRIVRESRLPRWLRWLIVVIAVQAVWILVGAICAAGLEAVANSGA